MRCEPHWPAVQFKDKRAITFNEHQAILNREKNLERKNFYELCWHLGGSQGDIASLQAEDVDWENQTISFTRKKTSVPVILHLGAEALNALADLPGEGYLFPYLAQVRAGDRATEFKQRCVGLGIHGVSLHSYRYAWAERAKTCGYPERFAQEALAFGMAGKKIEIFVLKNNNDPASETDLHPEVWLAASPTVYQAHEIELTR